MSIYEQLRVLSIELPEPTAPAAALAPLIRSGKRLSSAICPRGKGRISLRLARYIARKDGQPWVGQLGADISTAEGTEAARSVAVALMATLHAATGDLNKIARIVKLAVLINSTPKYTEQHLVANGALELFAKVFGDRVAQVRNAFGASQLPLGVCVEMELMAELAEGG